MNTSALFPFIDPLVDDLSLQDTEPAADEALAARFLPKQALHYGG
jgi:hypothetical protein